MKSLTIITRRLGTGEVILSVMDEQNKTYAELNEQDMDMLYFHGVFRERPGSREFNDHIKRFVRGN